MTRYVVVGGGVAGLVAARRLAKAGASVVLIEASNRLGGTVTHHTVGGLVLDAGAESFATRKGTVAALAGELGLEVVGPSAAAAWLQRGAEAFPLPATSLLGIPGVPLAQDVIDVVGQRTAFRAFLEALLPGTYGAKAQTLGELVRKRMGGDLLEKLVAPIAQGIHSAHPDDLALDRVAPGLRHALLRENSLARAVLTLREQAPAGSAVAGIRGGVFRLVDELVADSATYGVDVRLASRFDPVEFPGAVVVMAAPSGQVATRIALVTLVVDAPALDAAPRGSGVLVAEGSPDSPKRVQAKALTHATAKWPWLAERSGGKHVLRLSYSSPPENAAEAARTDAEVLLGAQLPAASIIDFAQVEWSRPVPRTEFEDGVTYIGEPTAGTGLANVVAQANTAVDELLAAEEGLVDGSLEGE